MLVVLASLELAVLLASLVSRVLISMENSSLPRKSSSILGSHNIHIVYCKTFIEKNPHLLNSATLGAYFHLKLCLTKRARSLRMSQKAKKEKPTKRPRVPPMSDTSETMS